MGIVSAFVFAAIFFGLAQYQHMNPWKWAIASIAVSFGVNRWFPLSFIPNLPAQFGLLLALWWMNARRKEDDKVERAALEAKDQRWRRERVTRAQARAQADPVRKRQEVAQAAEDVERRERVEGVRLAREQREREERGEGPQGGGSPPGRGPA